MQFLLVNFALNQKYYVNQEAFKQVIKKSISDIPQVKTYNIQTIIDKQSEQIEIIIKVGLKSKDKINESILKISSNVNSSIENLIDSKPKNIQIKVKGDFYG